MPDNRKVPSTDRLPYGVYAALIGFTAWMVLAAWGFSGPGYSDLSLAVVTGFFIIVIGIPVVLWRVWRASMDGEPEQTIGFGEWSAGEFETWQDRQKASSAATEIILPLAAAAVGMTAFAIVFHYAATHAAV